MINNSQKQRISITVDSQLLEEVDQLTKNRSAAVEEGLRLWRKQQIEEQLRNFYQKRSQADVEFEKEWARWIRARMEGEVIEIENRGLR